MTTCGCEKMDRIIDVDCEYAVGKFKFRKLPSCLPELFTVRFKAPADFTEGDTIIVKEFEMPVTTPGMTTAPTGLFANGAIIHCDIDMDRKLAFIIQSGECDCEPEMKALTQDTDFYVGLDGDDLDGDGTLASPWATLSGALDHLRGYHGRGYTATIKILDGTYKMNDRVYIWDGCLPGGTIRVTSASGNPESVVLHWPNAASINQTTGIMVHNTSAIIDSITIRVREMASDQNALVAYANALLSINSLIFEISRDTGRSIIMASSSSRIDLVNGSRNYIEVKTDPGIKIGSFIRSIYSCLIAFHISEIRWSGPAQFTTGFVHADFGATVLFVAPNTQFVGGTITGPRYFATRCGVCGTGKGENYLPGSQNGTVTRNGVYY